MRGAMTGRVVPRIHLWFTSSSRIDRPWGFTDSR